MRSINRRTDTLLYIRGKDAMTIGLEEIDGNDPGLRKALSDAALPIDDLEDDGRTFFKAIGVDGKTVGFSGIERCDGAVLLRSVVVLPEARGQGIGKAVTRVTLQKLGPDLPAFLATTSAASFFEGLGFTVISRDEVPASILSTRQLSGICPASATIMKLCRIPT